MRARTLLSTLCVAMALAGCAQVDQHTSSPSSKSEFVYDERDAIPNDVPLPKPRVNQRPVVGTKKVLVMVTHWSDGDDLDYQLIKKQTLSTDPDSLKTYINVASYGKLTLTGEVIEGVSGPRPNNCQKGTPEQPATMVLEEGKKIAQAQGINPNNFDYFIAIADCKGGAIAHLPGSVVVVFGQSVTPHVYKHEFGHNLGYDHGNTYVKCPKDNATVEAPNECTTIGYGDTGDSVSGGGTLYPANNRWYSGWLDNSEAGVIGRSGLYRLGVLGQSGPQLYLINRPGLEPKQIALEYRKPTFFDNFPPTDNRVNGVWVRYTTMGGNVKNNQLDATSETPTTTNNPTLQPGKTLKDSTAGISVHVCTTSPDGATVAVAINGETTPDCPKAGVPLLIPSIQTPALGAPAIPNPVVFAGKSIPGAKIELYYHMKDDEPELAETIADATGNWRIDLPSLPSGKYVGGVTQKAGDSMSLIHFRWFEVTQ